MSVSFLKKSELTALAAALALTTVAGEASAQDGRGRWNAGARADDGSGAGQARQQRQEARQVQQQERQVQQQQRQAQQQERQAQRAQVQQQRAQAPVQRAQSQFPGGVPRSQQAQRSTQAQPGGWEGRGRAEQAPRWGSQRSAEGQSYDRDRATGTVARPAPAWRGASPQAQAPAQQAQRSTRTWQDRNGDDRRWDGNRDTVTRNGSTAQTTRNRTYRDGSRDDRNWSSNRTQGTWSGERYRQAYRNGDYNRWDRNDWRRDNRYDWQRYRNQNRTTFRIGVYYSPYSNWNYRRFGIGSVLQSLLFSNRYWINDPWQYRLPEVYGPYRWVRYYDDVLLVDIYSGQVVDVIHDFFW